MFIRPEANQRTEDDLARWYGRQEESWGYLPNYASLFASRPDVAEAWTRLNITIREGMDRRRFELVTIAAARSRSSTYCTAAHSKFLRDVCSDETAMIALASDPSGSSLDPVDQAVVGFAAKVATDPVSVDSGDVDRLREHGLTDAEIADVIFAVAARCFFATALDASGTEPDWQLGAAFDPQTRADLAVGRPFPARQQ